MKNPGRIFITGDIHGQPQLNLSTHCFPEGNKLSKKDVVIILGDFGLLWSYRRSKEEAKWLKWLDDKPWTTLFIDGNHENFDLIDNLQEREMFGDFVGIVGHSIFHLKRGHIYRINNKKFLTIGGAHSHDRQYREWGKSMWKQEEITQEDIDRATKAIQEFQLEGFYVDYILTHCAPYEYAVKAVPIEVMPYFQMDKSEEFLSIFKNTSGVQFSRWYFGHYHNNMDDPFMDQWTCLYDKIIEITEDQNRLFESEYNIKYRM